MVSFTTSVSTGSSNRRSIGPRHGPINPMSYHPKLCGCNLPAIVVTAMTVHNAGRRFYGCSRFGGDGFCGFQEWLDGPTPPHILEMLLEYKAMKLAHRLAESEEARTCDEGEKKVLLEEVKNMRKMQKALVGFVVCTWVVLCFYVFVRG